MDVRWVEKKQQTQLGGPSCTKLKLVKPSTRNQPSTLAGPLYPHHTTSFLNADSIPKPPTGHFFISLLNASANVMFEKPSENNKNVEVL